jgi:hypothetical protein
MERFARSKVHAHDQILGSQRRPEVRGVAAPGSETEALPIGENICVHIGLNIV